MTDEKVKKNKIKMTHYKVERPLAPRFVPRRPGAWRLIEVFTWVCILTMAAHSRGWEAFEPIVAPRWDLGTPGDRARAREFIKDVDPDLVVLEPPANLWGQVDLIKQRTPLQMRDLQRRRASARDVLTLVEEVLHFQRVRGRVVVKGPSGSRIWQLGTDQDFHGKAGHDRGEHRREDADQGHHGGV